MKKIELSIIKSEDGKFCVSLNDYRIAGPKPALTRNNVVQTFLVSIDDIARALDDMAKVYPEV